MAYKNTIFISAIMAATIWQTSQAATIPMTATIRFETPAQVSKEDTGHILLKGPDTEGVHVSVDGYSPCTSAKDGEIACLLSASALPDNNTATTRSSEAAQEIHDQPPNVIISYQ